MSEPVQLQRGEEVIATLRRHPVYVILRIIGTVIVVILLELLFSWLRGLLGEFLNTLFGWLIALAIIGGVLYVLFEFYRYWHDLWLVTNQRLIDSTRRSPFSHEVSSADLINVQDISTSKNGVFATLFDFGDVRCQTASASQGFVIRGVSKPNHVLDMIDEQRDKARSRTAASAS
ncbi:MAG: hypothetical protein J5I90_20460 [Caldilineales bacterium]|nr:hypothetical protein [Caldilineales bacterium]